MASFIKMHGLGNDFVIFDGRKKPVKLTAARARAIADRRRGVGCDQVIVLEGFRIRDSGFGKNKSASSLNPESRILNPAVTMRIINADGGEVESCGNAARCVAWLLMEESGKKEAVIDTKGGKLYCERAGKMAVTVDMGAPVFDWKKIPLSREVDVMALPLGFRIQDSGFGKKTLPESRILNPESFAVSMGNPHLIIPVEDAGAVALEQVGPKLEHHPLFPKRTNVSFAQVMSKTKIKLRVWERGAGATLACGTAACATLAALHQAGMVSNKADVELPGGVLHIEWNKKSGHILMTGAVAVGFEGILSL